MFEKLEVTRMADAMANHAGARMTTIARNVANADTPGYQAQDLPDFASTYEATDSGLRMTRPQHLAGAGAQQRPGAVTSAGAAAPNGNTVSLEQEMVKAVEVRQQHDVALSVYQSASRLLRTSLGRGS